MLIKFINTQLDQFGAWLSKKKVRVNRIQNYMALMNFAILLSIKFEGKSIDWTMLLIPFSLVVVSWFDKRYIHKHEITYLNSKNDFVRHVSKELRDIKAMIGIRCNNL